MINDTRSLVDLENHRVQNHVLHCSQNWNASNNEESNNELTDVRSRSKEKDNARRRCSACCSMFAMICCPPCVCLCPSILASRIAFMPPKPTYEFIPAFEFMDDKLKSGQRLKKKKRKDCQREQMEYYLALKESARWPFGPEELDNVRVHYTITRRKKEIACMFFKCSEEPKFTILYSHGNASDLGGMAPTLLQLGLFLRCNVFSYDYSGYGSSSGKPSEENAKADIEAAFQALQNRWDVKQKDTILYGQSIGSAPTCHLAARVKVAGVVIHSGFMSGIRVFCPNKETYCCFKPGQCCDGCCDALVNISECPKIESTVLVIHGKDDDLIHCKHGRALYETCPNTVEPLFLENADHNNVPMFVSFWFRLKKFIDIDLRPRQTMEPPVETVITSIEKDTSIKVNCEPSIIRTTVPSLTQNQDIKT